MSSQVAINLQKKSLAEMRGFLVKKNTYYEKCFFNYKFILEKT